MLSKTNVSSISVGILVVLIVLVQMLAASSGLLAKKYKPLPRPASSPPGVVFAVVWPVLYVLAAVALWLQVTSPSTAVSPAVQWTGVGLMAAQLMLGFAWMPVFASGRHKAATWIIVAMLVMSFTGTTLASATNIVASTLWAPYIAWLIFALVLSAQVDAGAVEVNKHTHSRISVDVTG